jgi:protein SCO1/2
MKTGRHPVRLMVTAAALVVTLGLLAGCGDSDSDGDGATGDDGALALAGVVRTPALDVSAVELPNASGTEPVPTAMRADDGEVLLVYFGYTSCPDICPTTLSDISVALGDLSPDLAERVTVGMVTVDPERDTAEVLSGYLGHFFERSMALRTEDPDALATAASAFGVRYEVAEHEAGDDAYEVSHSAVTYVVDDTGTVLVEWPFGFESADMAADLTAVLERTGSA